MKINNYHQTEFRKSKLNAEATAKLVIIIFIFLAVLSGWTN